MSNTQSVLIWGGLAVNILDAMTSLETDPSTGTKVVNPSKGLFFGETGILAPINRVVPQITIPLPFIGTVGSNLATWAVLVGLTLWFISFAKRR